MFAKNREVKPSEKAVQFVIKKQEDIKRMMNNKESVGAIVIDEDVCNDMKEDLVIEHFENLRSILVRKKSMKNLKHLKISECESLEKIEITNGYYSEKCCDAFENVSSVDISSLIDLNCLI